MLHPRILVHMPSPHNPGLLRLKICGPDGSPYAKGVFEVEVVIPSGVMGDLVYCSLNDLQALVTEIDRGNVLYAPPSEILERRGFRTEAALARRAEANRNMNQAAHLSSGTDEENYMPRSDQPLMDGGRDGLIPNSENGNGLSDLDSYSLNNGGGPTLHQNFLQENGDTAARRRTMVPGDYFGSTDYMVPTGEGACSSEENSFGHTGPG